MNGLNWPKPNLNRENWSLKILNRDPKNSIHLIHPSFKIFKKFTFCIVDDRLNPFSVRFRGRPGYPGRVIVHERNRPAFRLDPSLDQVRVEEEEQDR
ncbi:hypothetical protein HRG_014615 [Hirsutella rhossiliensis]